ncbi:SLBB domain-containing protein [Flavobacteriaceae bacterium]|nr:SLBB domain-containing protein [Flavobacteriaceae bacterium]
MKFQLVFGGGAENEYNTIINTNGFIKLERIPPIYLSGYSIFSAKKRVGNALSKIYAGINSTSESYQKVYFDIALKNTRSIVLNIVGNVMTPGTYTLSSMTSPLNALYAAGGPNENGSFRNVKVLRNGKTFKTIDLYDYFAKGVYPTLSLRDQDVILVPSYSKRVFINGEFKQEGIFELKEKETLEDLLVFSGGFSSFAYKNKLFVESISGVFKQIKTFDKTDFDKSFLNDGDVITANTVSDKFLNKVSVEGAVYLPGDYQIENVKTIKGLISAASGLKENAQNSRAFLIRKKNGIMQEMISIDLNDVLNKEKDISLSNGDKLIISNKEDLKEESSVFIKGEVNEPGKYPYYQGMTVADLVLTASGFKNNANSKQIDLYKLTYDPTGKSPIELKQASLNIDFSLNNETNNLTLDSDDMVIVRSKEGFKQKKDYVILSGLVKRPGEYGIIDDSYSLYDLLTDAGGLLPNASLNGLKIKRLNTFKEESEEIFNSLDSLNIEKAEIKEFIEFGVDAKKLFETKGEDPRYNVILKNEDEVSVAKIENTIEITGEVQQPTVINYEKGLTVGQAIINAGGVNDLAKKGGAFVVYQNGRVKSNRKYFLIFNSMPKLEPGCKIIVPRKVENPNKTSLGEIIGLTSTLASLAILIRSL